MRWKRRGVLRTASGAVIAEASVQVYLAGTTDPAGIYEGPSGGASVNQISADSEGRYEYYVDADDYNAANRFKEVITKGSTSTTLDNIPIVRWDPTVHQSIEGEIIISGTGHGVTFPDGTRMTSMASPGSGVTAEGDINIAADTDGDGSGIITFSTNTQARARVPNAGGFEINDGGTWRQVASLDGTETLSNKTLASPNINNPAISGTVTGSPTIDSPVLNGTVSGSAIKDEDDMASNSDVHLATQQSIRAYVKSLIPVGLIELTDWQTNPNEYTVKAMNIDNIDGVGADSFFKYVLPDGISPMMRTQTYPLPFSGYDLQFNFSWRGTVAGDGSSYAYFRADVAAIPAGVAVGQITTWAEWQTFFNAYNSVKKTTVTYTPIPTGSADTFQMVTGTNLVVPAAICAQGDVLLINFWRVSTDTYSGQVEVGKISLVPVLA